MPPKKLPGTLLAYIVTCPECGVHAEKKVAGPTSQKPGKAYWLCNFCQNNLGKAGKFIRWEDEFDSPKKNVPYPKKRKTEPPPPSLPFEANEELNKKVDKLLGMIEEIYSMLQRSDSPPGSSPEEEEERAS